MLKYLDEHNLQTSMAFNNNKMKEFVKTQIDDINKSANFLIESGFGKIRYYNNKFQYYNDNTSNWIDIIPTQDNSFFLKLTPSNVQRFLVVCNTDTLNIEIKLKEPVDTIVENQALCLIEKVIVRRKKDSYPIDENDGDHVFTINRNEFGKYNDIPFIDEVSGEINDVYYYKAFPVSTIGVVNYAEVNNRKCKIKDYYFYGLKLDQNEADPNSMIQYLDDVDNIDYSPVFMDYNNDKFNYGDWEYAWFIKNLKPCMLNYDGTVAYELDKNNYKKKKDGTDSDVTKSIFEGNVMIGFPKIYWKIIDNQDNTVNIYFSDKKLDDDYVCWCNINELGEEIDYFYVAAYNSCYVNPRIRSLSGQTMDNNHYHTTDFSRAQANNIEGQKPWNIELFIDRMLIDLLLLLIGKSTDTQTVFGLGYLSHGGATGLLDDKGLFYGKNTSNNIKVFGIENYWGNKYRYGTGVIMINGIPKIKLTHSTLDGSTTEGYNTTGEGYISLDDNKISASGYISKMRFINNVMFPCEAQGSATTKYCDYIYINNSGTRFVLFGAYASPQIGAFLRNFNVTTSGYESTVGSALSCKPLNPVAEEIPEDDVIVEEEV